MSETCSRHSPTRLCQQALIDIMENVRSRSDAHLHKQCRFLQRRDVDIAHATPASGTLLPHIELASPPSQRRVP